MRTLPIIISVVRILNHSACNNRSTKLWNTLTVLGKKCPLLLSLRRQLWKVSLRVKVLLMKSSSLEDPVTYPVTSAILQV